MGDQSFDYLKRVFDVNLHGVWLMTRAVAPHMVEQQYGRIVNQASAAAYNYQAQPGHGRVRAGWARSTTSRRSGASSASPSSPAAQLGRWNITVNCIAPGVIATEATLSVVPESIVETLAEQQAVPGVHARRRPHRHRGVLRQRGVAVHHRAGARRRRRQVHAGVTGALSIQESLYPELTCFGCGHAESRRASTCRATARVTLVVAEFTPWPEHDNGFGFLNGGIISTVLDCHGAAVVMWEAAQREWDAPPGAPVPFITAGFDVRFLRPNPVGADGAPRRVPGAHRRGGDRRALVELEVDEKVRATMTATWRRFRPR